VGVTILVTSLAMNFVHRGAYFPEAPAPAGAQLEKLPPPEAKADKRDADAEPIVNGADRALDSNGELANDRGSDAPTHERPPETGDREPDRGLAKD
jgi:hypothetical protein